MAGKNSYNKLKNLTPITAGDEMYSLSAASILNANRTPLDSAFRTGFGNSKAPVQFEFSPRGYKPMAFLGLPLASRFGQNPAHFVPCKNACQVG